jgi:hypothetical protein
MNASQQPLDSPGTDLDELARTEAMITRCEARITAQLELLANLSPWEPKSVTVRQEVEVEEGVLQSLQDQRTRLLSAVKEPPAPWAASSRATSRLPRWSRVRAQLTQLVVHCITPPGPRSHACCGPVTSGAVPPTR